MQFLTLQARVAPGYWICGQDAMASLLLASANDKIEFAFLNCIVWWKCWFSAVESNSLENIRDELGLLFEICWLQVTEINLFERDTDIRGISYLEAEQNIKIHILDACGVKIWTVLFQILLKMPIILKFITYWSHFRLLLGTVEKFTKHRNSPIFLWMQVNKLTLVCP